MKLELSKTFFYYLYFVLQFLADSTVSFGTTCRCLVETFFDTTCLFPRKNLLTYLHTFNQYAIQNEPLTINKLP